MMRRLHPSNLHQLSDDVSSPEYDRESLNAGIVHMGLGAFHRAHQAVYTDEAIAQGGGDWGIVGVSLRSDSVAQQLQPQAGLYSVLSRDATRTDLRIVGSIINVLFAPDNPGRVADAIANTSTRLVTLTITEKGYCLASDGCSLDRHESLIEADLSHPHTPASAIGLLALGLHKRLADGGEPLTILSCDNLSENSTRLKGVLIEYLQSSFIEVIPWLEKSVCFPCSMVDRIVPGTTAEQKIAQAELLGVNDEGAVSTECFKQWIIEDEFATDRPAWDQVGVEFVDDIVPFENMKLRVLNASHSAIAFCGLVAGQDTVDQVMADEQFAGFITELLDTDLIPAIDPPAGFDLNDYRDQLLLRFKNPHLKHRCAQIAMDSSEKLSQRWLPAFRSANRNEYLTIALSLWCYLVLYTEVNVDDPQGEQLLSQRNSVESIANRVENTLAMSRFHTDSVNHFETLVAKILVNLDILKNGGIRELL